MLCCRGFELFSRWVPLNYFLAQRLLKYSISVFKYGSCVFVCPWHSFFILFLMFFTLDKPSIKPRNLSSITICEHKAAKVACKAGQKMKIVQARYGRSNKRTCKGGPIRTTKCKATKSLAIVRKYCHEKASCVLRANNSVFGDPCVGTYKYLTVKYRCSKWG